MFTFVLKSMISRDLINIITNLLNLNTDINTCFINLITNACIDMVNNPTVKKI